jgi:hypothetical protein
VPQNSAQPRIRQVNYLDSVADTLATCQAKIDEDLPAAQRFREAIANSGSGWPRCYRTCSAAGTLFDAAVVAIGCPTGKWAS